MQRILFVDDEPAVLSSLQRMVRAHAIQAETEGVDSANAALKRVARGDIDIMVIDVRMPGMDGIELLTRLKANVATQQIPVIMLTGDSDSAVRNVAIELGAVEFVNKPADPEELAARLRNVARLKAYQDQLVEQNNELARQVVQAQKMEIAGILASQAAHDLNNILASILGNTELAMFKTDDQELQQRLEKIVDAAQHARHLLIQILDLGRRTSDASTQTDPGAVIDQCLGMLGVTVPRGITINWTNPHLSLRVRVEPTAFYQIVMNLAINAAQAMGDSGRMTIELTEAELRREDVVEHDGVSAGQFMVLRLSDTGCGIDSDTVARIFEPFFTTKGLKQGSGIGLSVVHRIVTDHGGFIKVSSVPGEGTTFTIALPAVLPDEHMETAVDLEKAGS